MASDPDGVYRGQNLGLRGFPMDGLKTDDYYQERQCKGDRKRRLTSFMGTCNLEDSNKKMKKLVWGSRTLLDREPGEFSGGSSSGVEDGVKKSEDEDEATSGKKKKLSQSVLDLEEKKQISYRIEDRVKKLEDEDEATSKKKRKLSPSVCDLENKKIVHLHNAKTWNVSNAQFLLPSLPAMTKVFSEPKPVRRVKNTEQLCASLVQKESIRYAQGLHVEDGDEPEQMEEIYGRSRAISSSRWADANYVIDDDECTTYGVNFSTKRRKKLPFISQDQKSDSSELIVGEGSEGSVSNASVSCDLFLEEDLNPLDNKIDYIYAPVKETDVEENDVSIETDTKDAICSFKMSEFVAPPYKRINMLQCCRSVDEFEKLNKINEGTYGIVFRARDKKSGEIVALKKVKMDKEREGFPLTSLREINILLSLYHPSIVEVKEVVMGSNLDGIFTVMEYMEHDLKGLIETMNKHFHLSEIKCLMLQLISGVKHLHDNWVLHRDLKPSNLLFNNRGELKICDFGLSRQYGSPLKPYTQMVVTLWYRAPELLLGAKEYSTAIDMWSVGCIMAELLAKEPLFPGKSELDQLDKIFNVLGTPDEKMWPGFTRLPGAKSKFTKKSSKLHEKFPRMSTSFFVRPSLSNTGFDLLNKLFTYDPDKRITAVEALNHPWFVESPLPTSKDFMPTFPAQHVQDRHQRKALKISDSLNLRR